MIFAPTVEANPEARTDAVARVLADWRAADIFPELGRNWKDEIFPVSAGFHAPALFCYERAAAGLFGVAKYATHLNVFVRNHDATEVRPRGSISACVWRCDQACAHRQRPHPFGG